MHTASSRQILSPVADAISQLIIVSSDAETYNTPMQDLTEVATVVNSQAENLVQIGQSMLASSNDEQLKHEMPQACSQSKTSFFRDHLSLES